MTCDDSGAYLLQIPEFGRRIGVGRSKAYELVSDGAVRSVWIGGRRLVPVAELERFVAELVAAA